MINVVYLDVYFCFNFLMDFFVLYVTSKFLNQRYTVTKITIAALIGTVYATIVVVIGKIGLLESILTYFLIPIIMAIVLVKNKNIRNVFKFCTMLYLFTFILSGMIYAVYYSSNIGMSLFERAINCNIAGINIGFILTVLIFILAVLDFAKRHIKKDIKCKENIYDVILVVSNVKIRTNALRDTGNQLKEPITGKSVAIIEEELIKNVDIEQLGKIIIPYKSVGKEHGLMEGFVGDRLEIEGHIVNKPIIGIHKGKLSSGNEYNLILPPNILGEERV